MIIINNWFKGKGEFEEGGTLDNSMEGFEKRELVRMNV